LPSVVWKGSGHPYRENQIPKLSDADANGQFVRVTCKACRIIRHYRPADIRRLLQQDLHVLKLQNKFRCDRCGSKDRMLVEFKSLMGDTIVGLVVRELLEVRMVRRPVWRDKKM
jgi:predicted nucleic-acid-binding Zn-ribbon protein